MIVYSETRDQFTRDVFSNRIEDKILAAFQSRLGYRTSAAEIESWKNSMQYMNNVLVGGGHGTGKSVVAVNLLVELTRRGQVAQYVSRNAAPRAVYESKLAGTFRKTHVGFGDRLHPHLSGARTRLRRRRHRAGSRGA